MRPLAPCFNDAPYSLRDTHMPHYRIYPSVDLQLKSSLAALRAAPDASIKKPTREQLERSNRLQFILWASAALVAFALLFIVAAYS